MGKSAGRRPLIAVTNATIIRSEMATTDIGGGRNKKFVGSL
jgi:hypothetical protein